MVHSLQREQITTLLLSEERRTEYQRVDQGALSFLADSIILLRYVEIESEIQRAIVVLKQRGSDHDRQIRHYTIRDGGLVIGEPFSGRSSLLTGISQRA